MPGEDLGQRLAHGPLPVDEAIEVCRQIAEGLEAAHEAGVIHRDLKPANVRVTPDGVAKVLDFGLAKPIHPRAKRDGTTGAEPDSFLITEEGLVLGTPTYMSPEQARGKVVDRRTDLWAFGCVFYECLTGRRAFGGESMTDVLAAIVGEEPDWDLLPPLPARVRELLGRALAKNPRERLRDAGEARAQLELARAEGSRAEPAAAEGSASGTARHGRRGVRPVPLLIGALLAVGAGYALRSTIEPEVAEPVEGAARAERPMAVVLAETEEAVSDLELSPDGSRIAWTQPSGVYIRALDSFDPIIVTLEGTESALEGPYRLAWSPDGVQLAFTTPSGLWRVDADGKHLTLVTRDQLSPDSHAQLDWSRDGLLVYSDGASRDLFGRSFLVHETTPLVSADAETTLHFDGVHILPDGSLLGVRHRRDIGVPDTLSLWRDDTLRDVLQLPGWNITGPAFANGLLVFERKDTNPDSIWYVNMDLEAGRTVGDPRQIANDGQHVTVAGDTLAYVVADAPAGMRPVWIDLEGAVEILPGVSAQEVLVPTLSHDGRRVFIFDVFSGGPVWAFDGATGDRSRAGTLDQGTMAVGDLPDGRLITVKVLGGAPPETVATEPTGANEFLCGGVLGAVSRDGRLGVAFRPDDDESVLTPLLVDLVGGAEPIDPGVRLELGPGMHPGMTFGDISRDNRWALVPSSENGWLSVVVVNTSGEGQVLPLALDGAVAAWFSESGEAIYYWTPPDGNPSPMAHGMVLWRVAWQAEPEPTLGTAEKLFTLDRSVLITGFDRREGRFLGSWNRRPASIGSWPERRGWSPSSRADFAAGAGAALGRPVAAVREGATLSYRPGPAGSASAGGESTRDGETRDLFTPGSASSAQSMSRAAVPEPTRELGAAPPSRVAETAPDPRRPLEPGPSPARSRWAERLR